MEPFATTTTPALNWILAEVVFALEIFLYNALLLDNATVSELAILQPDYVVTLLSPTELLAMTLTPAQTEKHAKVVLALLHQT
jgi:hypothetical protein